MGERAGNRGRDDHGRGGGGLRLPRPQRRRQDDDDLHPARPTPSDQWSVSRSFWPITRAAVTPARLPSGRARPALPRRRRSPAGTAGSSRCPRGCLRPTEDQPGFAVQAHGRAAPSSARTPCGGRSWPSRSPPAGVGLRRTPGRAVRRLQAERCEVLDRPAQHGRRGVPAWSRCCST